MALTMREVRKFVFQNPTSEKLYEVQLQVQPDGSVDGVAWLLGTSKINSDPLLGNTKVTFVVLTTAVAKAYGTAALHDSALAQGAWYDAANPAGAGAALSTLLV